MRPRLCAGEKIASEKSEKETGKTEVDVASTRDALQCFRR